jgi:uncharacterized protein YndB with AHSA1/START domain
VSGEITITRTYDAPRERVWAAWTEPERLAAWWGKRGWRTPPGSVTIELRPGGAFRLLSISEADGATMTLDATYLEVVAPERLVFGDPAGTRRSSVTFTDLGAGRTEMTFHTTQHTDADPALRERATAGLASAFDRLAEQLATTPTQETA